VTADDRLTRFTDRAEAYVAARPSYPLEAVDALLAGLGDPSALVVADLGAGTGISSRLIASRGPRVLAIEPNAKMREAADPDPRVEWIEGIAEATTLEAGSVDVAAAFQAWHWVDHPAAIAEARRIVRPGGCMAIVYNERDEEDPFTRAYGSIVRRFAQDRTEARRAEALEAFVATDRAHMRQFTFRNMHELDRVGVHQRAESSSYLPKTGEAATAMHIAIDDLLDEFHAASYAMRLVTLVVRIDV
jgi:SAM-dependent methyltransferase